MPATLYAIPAPATTAPAAEVRRKESRKQPGWFVRELVVHGVVVSQEALCWDNVEELAAEINRAAKGAGR